MCCYSLLVSSRTEPWCREEGGSLGSLARASPLSFTESCRKQKGTGRARQGSIRAPHYKHGGKAHGPVQ
eukprot:765655-Hanusia_phi.AAC.1